MQLFSLFKGQTNFWKKQSFGLLLVLNFLLFGFNYGLRAQQTVGYNSPVATFRLATELFTRDEFGAASIQYALFLKTTDNATFIPEATYKLAHCHLKLNYPIAIKELETFEAEFPGSEFVALSVADRALFYYQGDDFGRVTELMAKQNFDNLPKATRSELIFKTAYSHLSRKEFSKADSLFDKIKDEEHAYTAAANYYSGYLAVKNNKLDAAVKSLEKAEQDQEYRKMTPLLRTVIYYRNKKWDQAIASGERWLNDTSNVSGEDELTRLVAESYYNKNKYKEAAKYYQEYLKQNPNNSKAFQYRVGYSLFMAEDFEKSLDQFGKVIEQTPDSVAGKDSLLQYAYYYSGVASIKLNNKAVAIANFDKSRKISTSKSIQETSWFNYGKLLYEQEKFEEAIVILKEFDARYPDSKIGGDVQELITEALLSSSSYDEALKYIYALKKRSLRVDRAFQRVNYQKGLQFYNQGRYTDAVGYLESSLKINEDSSIYSAAALLDAEALLQTRKFQESIARYKLLQRGPNQLPYYQTRSRYGIAYAYYNLKDYEKASLAFTELLAYTDTSSQKSLIAEAKLRIADCFYVRKKYKDAFNYYDVVSKTGGFDPDYATYQKGVMQSLLGDADAAMTTFDYTASTYMGSPYQDLAFFQKANILFDRNRYQESINAFAMVIGQGASATVMPLALIRRAQAYYNLKNYAAATEDYKQIIDQFPTSKQADDAILGLQEVNAHSDGTLDLPGYLTKFKTANPESKSTQNIEYEAAKNLFFSQKYNEALTAFNAFVAAYPSGSLTSESYYYMAESYFRKNDRANSIAFHKKVLEDVGNSFYNKSLSRLAELALSGSKPEEAKAYYASLVEKAKNKKEAVAGTVGLMETYYALNKPDSCLLLSDKILKTNGTPQEAINKANLYRGKIEVANNELDKALDDLLGVVNNAKDATGAEALYLVAEIQYKQAKFSESIETLFDLNKTYSGYPKWYDKSFMLIAENYLVLGKTQLARYTLQNLIDKTPSASVKAEAKAKLAGIK